LYASQAARGNPPVLITSGGQGPRERLPEARAMADYLIRRGIPGDRVACEERSRNTDQNLRFSKAIMQERIPGYLCVVVTSNFHVFRAAITARRTGVNGQVVGSPNRGVLLADSDDSRVRRGVPVPQGGQPGDLPAARPVRAGPSPMIVNGVQARYWS
jgi:hypothetical protein